MNHKDQKLLDDFLARGGSMKILCEMDESALNTIYNYAYQIFESGQISEAQRLFYFLSNMDQWNFDYLLALGICYQRLGEHEQALYCFSRSGQREISDPRSSYYAGLSYQQLGNAEYAKKAFDASVRWCSDKPEYQDLKPKVSAALARTMLEI
ncbi:SycD/LcrH family type III secretion system chaperone [Dongshaea marina]|uniref:SycD/LcrH family type III secretion system chaperone n=1 Tax=Dongshaea marina TaxID=2047966 RepID=UPI000D3E27F3|nr:SycD/LcrH family type III secretion system chaperone [Dongshaea marina]